MKSSGMRSGSAMVCVSLDTVGGCGVNIVLIWHLRGF